MQTYTTISGDTWDKIAHDVMGESILVTPLMENNIEYIHITIFPAGVTLTIPENAELVSTDDLPPWKRDDI